MDRALACQRQLLLNSVGAPIALFCTIDEYALRFYSTYKAIKISVYNFSVFSLKARRK